MNLTDPILRHARMQPDVPAVVDGDRTITYRTLADLVLRTAGHLAALDVQPGEYVGLCLRDDWQHVAAFLAVARLGAVAVQIDWRSRPAETARIASAFPLKLALAMPESNLAAACPHATVDDAWHKRVAAAPLAGDPPQPDGHAPVAVLASSGTTGIPKFTLATHLQLYLRVAAYLTLMPGTRRHNHLGTLSLAFSAGRHMCLAALIRGDTLILGPSFFTAAEFAKIAIRRRATVSFVPPSVIRQLAAIAEDGKPLFPDMDLLMYGGAPLFAEEKREALRKLTRNFYGIYGAAPIGPVTVLRPEDIAERAGSVGRPFPFVEVDVVDEEDRPLGPEITGRLRCRGPGLASPIPGLSGPSEDFRNGWHYPGELATLDGLEYVHIQGRTSEVIFRGGAKIFPAEVEAVLQAHDGVAEAAVVGRACSGPEQELVAYVVASRALAPGEILAHCRTRLTAYKVPREIHVVPELPRNASGKLDKRALTNGSP